MPAGDVANGRSKSLSCLGKRHSSGSALRKEDGLTRHPGRVTAFGETIGEDCLAYVEMDIVDHQISKSISRHPAAMGMFTSMRT